MKKGTRMNTDLRSRIARNNLWMMALVIVVLAANVFAKAKMVQSWADPSASSYQVGKVVTVAVLENVEMRRNAEGSMARNIKKVQAIESISLLKPGEAGDIEAAKRKVAEAGVDCALIMRIFQTKEKAQQVGATFPDPYINYWSMNPFIWPITATPGYIYYKQTVQLEVLFYSIKLDKLLWAAIVEADNPAGVFKLIDDIAPLVAKDLQKKGIVK
jgi:hypothetical protein